MSEYDIKFTADELATIFYLGAMGLASMMKNSPEEVERKDADIMYLSAAMGIKDLDGTGFSDGLKKLDEIRTMVVGNDVSE